MLRDLMSFRDLDIKVNWLLKGERKTNKESTRFQECGCYKQPKYSEYFEIRTNIEFTSMLKKEKKKEGGSGHNKAEE